MIGLTVFGVMKNKLHRAIYWMAIAAAVIALPMGYPQIVIAGLGIALTYHVFDRNHDPH